MKIIDLSVPIKNSSSEPMKLTHTRIEHKEGALQVSKKAGISVDSFPNNEFISLDTFKLATHMGTHVDSPFHFGSKFQGEEARTIDKVPLDWFYSPGVKLDFTNFPRKKNITASDIKEVIKKEKVQINVGDIVLIWTDMDKLWGSQEYFTDGPGMSYEATNYLINLGVKVMGIDSYGFDRSFPVMLSEFKRTKDRSVLWPSHFIGRDKEYVHIERLTNLDLLPNTGFTVIALPLKLVDGDASWIRAIAVEGEK
ncbi:cyclase family protein [Lapidilactobacillus mulanensis]|uniref:Cyclase family protein n=1 Tax=Lapidilactobacillus mulanensis TaxID=2485999 RepID=A0ABW4DNM3_9LACO|nr:cyclase family protein [Lapidilactobacillus mulanensis]